LKNKQTRSHSPKKPQARYKTVLAPTPIDNSAYSQQTPSILHFKWVIMSLICILTIGILAFSLQKIPQTTRYSTLSLLTQPYYTMSVYWSSLSKSLKQPDSNIKHWQQTIKTNQVKVAKWLQQASYQPQIAHQERDKPATQVSQNTVPTASAAPLSAPEAFPSLASFTPSDTWLTLNIRRGDSLSSVFSRNQLSSRDLHKMLKLKEFRKALRRIRPGQALKVKSEKGRITALHMVLNVDTELLIKQDTDSKIGFLGEVHTRKFETKIRTATATINASLYKAGNNAGLKHKQLKQLMKIFSWDIDFAHEIQAGDRFTVVYEDYYYQGKKVKTGNVLAAEFINNGHIHRAVRYVDAYKTEAYYTPEGRSLQKAFTRTPVKAGIITSKFNLKRKHPVLNRIRAHKGVDYGARTGSRVYATGKGRVIFKGWKGGYGKTVIVSHGEGYTTLYGHLSKYAKGLKKGSRVNQDQVIAYVGKTGLATGPHLHYEFRKNGTHKDPLRVKLPTHLTMAKKQRTHFNTQINPLLSQLRQASALAFNTVTE
jgi:murein DD-endopeptidase MepM/ murein hydrolase activator NlpD